MENNRKQGNGKGPLLYIHQPDFETPHMEMQQSFSNVEKEISENNDEKKVMDHVKQNNSSNIEPSESSDNDLKAIIGEIGESEKKAPVSAADYFRRKPLSSNKREWNLTPLKSFKDMSIIEKLQYLSRVSTTQPPFPCEFITEENNIKGILEKFEGDQVSIKNIKGELVEIIVEDLKMIRIIF